MDNEELVQMLLMIICELKQKPDENHGIMFENDVCKMYNSVVYKDAPYKPINGEIK